MGLIGFSVLMGGGFGHAEVLWHVQKTLKLETGQLDLAVSENGKWIYILTDSGEIQIFSSTGRLKGRVPVGKRITQIKAGPGEDLLLLSSPADKAIQVLSLEFTQEINTIGSPVRGDAAAPVSIVLFAEFQCPYCARLLPLLEQVLAQNKGKVKLVFKHFPLKMHQFALAAAVASEVAAKTGEFWVFHDRLFEAYDQLSNEKILSIAAELGFDRTQFEKEMKDPALFKKIQADIDEGLQADVGGVPKVFINGRQLRKRTIEGFQELIDDALKKTME